MDFDGQTYTPGHDRARLSRQYDRIFALMEDGAHRTLGELAAQVSAPEASVSARLRDMRKPKFGSHSIERRHRGAPADGLYEYRLVVNRPPTIQPWPVDPFVAATSMVTNGA